MKTPSLFRSLRLLWPKKSQPVAGSSHESSFELEPLEGRILLSATPVDFEADLPPLSEPVLVAPLIAGSESSPDTLEVAAAGTVEWIADSNGFWDVASNWSTGVVPGPDDDVVINRSAGEFTITIRSGMQSVRSLVSAENIALTGGFLTIAEESSISGDFTISSGLVVNGVLTLSGDTLWTAGSLNGTGKLVNTGAFSKGPQNLTLGIDLENSGTLSWNAGQIAIVTDKSLTNLSDGVVQLSGSATVDGPGVFANAGTVNVTGGSPRTGVLQNSGTVNIDAGVFFLISGGSSSGTFAVDADAEVRFSGGGEFRLQPGAELLGDGIYSLSDFGHVVLDGEAVEIRPRHLVFGEFVTMSGAGQLTIEDGALFEFHGGTFSATGGLKVESGGEIGLQFNQAISGTTLTNHGEITMAGATFSIFQGGTLANALDGVINVTGNSSIQGPAGSIIANIGAIHFNSAGANLNLGLQTNHSGLLHAQAGTISITGAFTSSGDFEADAGAQISFDHLSTLITPGTDWNGPGNYRIRGGVTLETGVVLTVLSLELSGTLTNNGAVTIPSAGALKLPTGATLGGTGATTIAAGASMTGAALVLNTPHTLHNSGLIVLTGVSTSGAGRAIINNQPDAYLEIAPAVGQGFVSFGGRLEVNNLGYITFRNGPQGGSFDALLLNNGTVQFGNGGVVSLSSLNVSGTSSGNGILDVDANTVLDFRSAFTFNAGAQWLGIGTYRFTTGNVTLNSGAIFSPHRAEFLSVTVTGAGAVSVPAGKTWTFQATAFQSLAGLTIADGAVFNGSFGGTFTNTAVTNHGLVTVAALGGASVLTLASGASFLNSETGEVHFIAPDEGTVGFGNSSGASFTNRGLLRRTNGSGEFIVQSGLTFSNEGTFENASGGARIFGHIPQLSADKTRLIGGTWRILGGSTLILSAAQTQDVFGNPLSIVLENEADVTLAGAGASFNALRNLALNSGRIALLEGATLSTALYLVDPGSENPLGPLPGPLENSGVLEIGAGSTLTVTEDFTQSSGGELIVHLAQALPAGRIAVTGEAALGGELRVLLDGGFIPSSGAFQILSYASRTGNFTTFGGVQPLLFPAAGATAYTLSVSGSASNLVALAVSGTGGAQGEIIDFEYTVRNASAAATNAASWTDSLYLSASPVFNPATAVLLGRKVHSGALVGGEEYDDVISAVLPALPAGEYYLFLVADSRGEVADAQRADNIVPGAPITIDDAELLLEDSVDGTVLPGGFTLYRISLPAGATRVVLDTAIVGGAELYVSAAPNIPGPSGFEFFAFDPSSDRQEVIIDAPFAGDYYIVVRGSSLAGAGAPFTLSATEAPFALDDASPVAGTNNGEVTLTVRGVQLSSSAVFSLVPVDGGPAIAALSVVRESGSKVFVTFDLDGADPGEYDIVAINGSDEAALPGAFTVLGAPQIEAPLRVSVTLTAPARTRVGRPGTLVITVTNATGSNVPSPLLTLVSDNARLRMPDSEDYQPNFVEFFVVNPDGVPNILPPGFQATYLISFLPFEQGDGVTTNFRVYRPDLTAPLDPGKIENDARILADYTPEEWAQIAEQLSLQLGPTVGSYEARLRELIPLLPAGAGNRATPSALLGIEVLRAEAAITTSIQGRVEVEGIALGGRTVYAQNLADGELFGAAMLNDGSFIFTRLTPGNYTFFADDVLIADHAPIVVAEDDHLTGVSLAAEIGDILHGAITGPNGAVTTAELTLEGADGRLFVGRLGANGAYQFTGLTPGAYLLVVEAEGLARFTAEVVISGSEMLLDLAMAPGASLAGTAPAGADVYAVLQGSTDRSGRFSVTADENGEFVFEGLPEGTYDLLIDAPGYLPIEETGFFVAEGDETAAGTFAGVLASAISGSVIVLDPTINFPLVVAAYREGVLMGTATTDAEGNYQIPDLPAGLYTITLIGATRFVESAELEIGEGENASADDVVIRAGGILAGSVTDQATGDVLAGLTVYAQHESGEVFRGVTDALGAYRITGLPAGEYYVYLSLAGAAETVTVMDVEGTATTLDFQAALAARLSGQVRLSDGTPAAGARVQLLVNGVAVAASTADAEGFYGFLLQEEGVYELRAVASNAAFAPLTGIVVNAGESVVRHFESGDGVLAFTLTGGNVEGSIVRLVNLLTGEDVNFAIVGASGQVTFNNLEPGNYRLVARASENRGAYADVTVTAGAVTSANIPLATLASVSGTVATPSGGPALTENAVVTLYSTTDPLLSFTGIIAEDGSFRIDRVPAGDYVVVLVDEGYRAAQQTISVSGDSALALAFTQEADTALHGRILDTAGLPVVGAAVAAEGASGRILARAVTDAEGYFTLAGLAQSGVKITYRVQDIGPFVIAAAYDASTLPGAPDGEGILGVVEFSPTAAALDNSTPAPSLAAARSGGQVAAFQFPRLPTLVDSFGLFNKVRQKAENFKEDAKHVRDPFSQSPECINCDSERNRARGMRDIQDLSYKQAEELKKRLLNQVALATTTILRETGENFANMGQIISTVIGFIGLLAPAAEFGLATIILGAGIDLSISAIQAMGAVNNLRDPERDPEDVTGQAEIAAQLTTNLGKSLLTIVEVVGEAIGKRANLAFGVTKQLFDLANNASQGRGTIASLQYTASIKAATEVAQLYKQFEEAKRTYKKDVPRAVEAKEAFYNCLKNGSSSPNCDHNGGNPGKPNDPNENGGGGGGGDNDEDDEDDSGQGNSLDPNDILGPEGYGPDHYVPASQTLAYTIRFENQATASANAAEVFITQTLDADLDLTTFRPFGYGFGGAEYVIPAGANPFAWETTLDLTESHGISLEVSVSLDLATRELSWTFRSIDPLTGDVPGDASLGFLPPNVTGPEGEGYVIYSIEPLASAPSGAVIDAQAEIVFDTNAAIVTPAIFNTLDAAAPESSVAPLPVESGPDFTLTWSAVEELFGSGVAGLEVFVRDATAGGPFALLLANAGQTALIFNGVVGHTYEFYSVATDFAGNREAVPAAPDAVVTIVPATDFTLNAKTPVTFLDANGDRVTIKLSGAGNGVVRLVYGADGHADVRSIVLTGTTVKSSLNVSVQKNGTTTVGRITTDGGLKGLTLGRGVTLGDGFDDSAADLVIPGALSSATFDDINAFAGLEIGSSLAAPDLAKLKPSFTADTILGAGVRIASAGGLGTVKLGSWAHPGELLAGGRIAGISAKGAFNASLEAATLGNVTAASIVAASWTISGATVGNVTTTAGPISGLTISAEAAKVGNITARHTTLATFPVAAIESILVQAAAIGHISATATGGVADTAVTAISNSLFLAAAGSIGNITAAATSVAPDATVTGIAHSVFAAQATMGNISASAKGTNKTPTGGRTAALESEINPLLFQAGTRIGHVTAVAQGAGGVNTAIRVPGSFPVSISSITGSIGNVTLTANKAKNASSAAAAGSNLVINTATTLGAVKIGGDATTTQFQGLVIQAGGKIASVSVSAKDKSFGSLTNSAIFAGQNAVLSNDKALAAASLGKVSISGSLVSTKLAASGNISGVAVGGTMSTSFVVAGVFVGADRLLSSADDTFHAHGSISSFSVLGAFSASSVVAGIAAGADFTFGSVDDAVAPLLTGLKARSRIGAITLGAASAPGNPATPFPPASLTHSFAIESLTLTSVKVGKLPTFKDFSTAHYLDADGNGVEATEEVLIRTLS